jgi:methylglyoxal synthase
MKVCDVHNIPLATNPATGELCVAAFAYADQGDQALAGAR